MTLVATRRYDFDGYACTETVTRIDGEQFVWAFDPGGHPQEQCETSTIHDAGAKMSKAGSAKGKKTVQQNLSGPGRMSKGVSDNIKLAMADAIMAFSDMEMSAEQFIWDLLGLSPDDGKLLTRIDTKDKIELAKKFSERYRLPLHQNEQTSADAWSAIRNAIEARNKMAHGVWMTIDLKTPVVVSYRIPIELGRINSEHFPLDRIEAVTWFSPELKVFSIALFEDCDRR